MFVVACGLESKNFLRYLLRTKTNFENLRIYHLAEELGDLVREVVAKWDFLSLFEVNHWVRRAEKRHLIKKNEIEKFQLLINELLPKISAYINSVGKKQPTINN